MQQRICIRRAGRIEQCCSQARLRTPSFFHAKRSTKGLPRYVKSAAFITKNVTPSTGSSGSSRRIASEGHRPGPPDHNNSWFAAHGPGKRDCGIVSNLEAFAANQFARIGLFIGRSSAESEACDLKFNRFRIKGCLAKGFVQALAHGGEEFPAPRFASCMIAGPAPAVSYNAALLVGDKGNCTGLAAIDSEIITFRGHQGKCTVEPGRRGFRAVYTTRCRATGRFGSEIVISWARTAWQFAQYPPISVRATKT